MEKQAPESATIRELRRYGRWALASGGTDSPGLDTDVLLGNVLGKDLTELIIAEEELVAAPEAERYADLVERRMKGEPVAYLTGRKEFYGLELAVTPDVLIPRPETELVVELAVEWVLAANEPILLCDVGTGSGAIAVAIAATVGPGKLRGIVASDMSAGALQVAAKNAAAHGLERAICFVRGDLLSWLRPDGAPPMLVVSNPPYIPDHEALPRTVADYEPAAALRGGPTGLELPLALLHQGLPLLGLEGNSGRGSALIMEIGAGQEHTLQSSLSSYPGIEVQFFEDLRRIKRAVVVRRVRS